jgi:myo-inositol 2-dehydrogenase/D-chiro-inositol 1-dehydrogenase
MTPSIGVIGVGMIGQDHIRRLTHILSNARVVAVTDVDPDRAADVARGLPSPARVHGNGQGLITDDDVDGVIVAS